MIFLLFALMAQDDLSGLLRDLASDDVERRGQAALRLEALGERARPALRKAAAEGDADLRGQAAMVLEVIARAERRRPVRPADARARLDLRETPFAEAVEKALSPFGAPDLPSDAVRSVSLRLEDATYWEAVDALEAASALRLDLNEGCWKADGPRRSGTSMVRVAFDRWHLDGTQLVAGVWLPPGAWAPEMEAEELELLDERGARLPADFDVYARGTRQPGRPSLQGLIGATVAAPRPGPLTLRGTLLVRLPRDVERHEADAERFPAEVRILGARVAIEALTAGRDAWEVSLRAAGAKAPFIYLMTLEDRQGWIGDLHAGGLRPDQERESRGSRAPLPRKPGRMVVYRPLEFDTLRVPFTLSGLPGGR